MYLSGVAGLVDVLSFMDRILHVALIYNNWNL